MDIYGQEEVAVEALVEVRATPQRGYGFDLIAKQIAANSEVKNLFLLTGGYDLLLTVQGKSVEGIARFVSEKIAGYTSVISTSTRFILKKYKTESAPYAGL